MTGGERRTAGSVFLQPAARLAVPQRPSHRRMLGGEEALADEHLKPEHGVCDEVPRRPRQQGSLELAVSLAPIRPYESLALVALNCSVAIGELGLETTEPLELGDAPRSVLIKDASRPCSARAWTP